MKWTLQQNARGHRNLCDETLRHFNQPLRQRTDNSRHRHRSHNPMHCSTLQSTSGRQVGVRLSQSGPRIIHLLFAPTDPSNVRGVNNTCERSTFSELWSRTFSIRSSNTPRYSLDIDRPDPIDASAVGPIEQATRFELGQGIINLDSGNTKSARNFCVRRSMQVNLPTIGLPLLEPLSCDRRRVVTREY